VAALALTDRDAEAREALQRYLAPLSTAPFKTIAAWKALQMSQGRDPRFIEMSERSYEALTRKNALLSWFTVSGRRIEFLFLPRQ
jgi:hypothetical protein